MGVFFCPFAASQKNTPLDMKLSKETQNKIINEVVKDWAAQELTYYFERAKKAGKATGKGQKDISVKTLAATTSGIAHVMFSFKDYMRYRDMKNLKPGHTPFEDALAWIQAKGTGRFKAGYKKRYGKLPTTDIRLMNEIAWGITKGKRRKHRRKNWLKGKWKGINVLEARLIDKLGDAYIQQLKLSLKSK